MICPPCKQAGRLLRSDIVDEAIIQHSQCQDPVTCPCKHEVLPADAVISGRKDG